MWVFFQSHIQNNRLLIFQEIVILESDDQAYQELSKAFKILYSMNCRPFQLRLQPYCRQKMTYFPFQPVEYIS